jgi:ABC-2 type transport system permease protein
MAAPRALAAVPLLALALIAPLASLVALLLAAGASASAALLNLWHPMPGNRRGMLRRHSQSKLLALIEHVIALLWAVAAVLTLLGSACGLAPAAVALAVLAAMSPHRVAVRERLAAAGRRPHRAPVEAATPGL